MRVERGGLVQHQPLEDFRSDQSVKRLEDGRIRCERLECPFLAHGIAQEVVDLLVAAQPVR